MASGTSKNGLRVFTVGSPSNSYLVSIQPERLRKKTRYQWTICRAQTPDQLLSWGHAPSLKEAESAAREEVLALSSGATEGGRVESTITPFTKRVNQYLRRNQTR
jgi:hypothetical protein